MKNVPIDANARADIIAQTEKVFRGLGNPEPPIRLETIRELLELDRQYYSSGDGGFLKKFVSRVRIGTKQIAKRPSLIKDVIVKAQLSALWIPDGRRILIDDSLPAIKQRWAEAHEIGHCITPWHQAYLHGDSKKELTPTCEAILEAEANFGAGQLLFLGKRFTTEALDNSAQMKTIQAMAKAYGNTITSTLWRFVEEVGREFPMIGLVSQHPHKRGKTSSGAHCRYFIRSPRFTERFSNVSAESLFLQMREYCAYSTRGPLGEAEICLHDDLGEPHSFHFESFSNTHEVLTLGRHVRKLGVAVGVL